MRLQVPHLSARFFAVVLSGLFLLTPALANENITYSYDPRGRLVQVSRTGNVNNGTSATYSYDKADNRTNVTVTTGGAVTLALTPSTLPNGTVGSTYSQTIAASGGTSPYTYATTAGSLPAGLSLNSSTGVLSGSPSTAATSSFTITATDSASHTGNRAYTVTISSVVTLTLTPSSLPGGTVGTAYSQTISASGGTAPYSYSISAGTLPAGLTLNASTGAIAGTPTTAATSSFTITGSDSASHSGSRAYSVTIANPVTLTLAPTTLPNGTVGTAYSQTVAASGGTSPYNYSVSAGALPPGLNLAGSTGVLSGTPTTAATSSFTINALDSASHSGSRAYTITMASGGGTGCSGVSFAINDVADDEGNPLIFTVTKTGTTTSTCTVNYATANGTAVAPGDYTAASGTLSFGASETTKTVSIATVIAGPGESDETMTLNLSGPSGGATISDSQGIGTIYNYVDGGGGGCTLC